MSSFRKMYLWLHMMWQQCSLKIGAEYFLPDPISSPHLHLRCLLNREFSSNWCLSQCEWFPIIEFSACTYSDGEFQLPTISSIQNSHFRTLGLTSSPENQSFEDLIFLNIYFSIHLINFQLPIEDEKMNGSSLSSGLFTKLSGPFGGASLPQNKYET